MIVIFQAEVNLGSIDLQLVDLRLENAEIFPSFIIAERQHVV